MVFKIVKTPIRDLLVIEPTVYKDERGFFMESFNHEQFENAIGREVTFVQDNHSKSVRGVLRGLHYQSAPCAQGKLVRVIKGKVFDVAVDIRESSPTFGHWFGEFLSAENKKQLWVPEGFAHGFLTLSATAELLYKTTSYYSKEHERALRWDDKSIGIKWPNIRNLILSAKDREAMSLKRSS